MKFNQLGNSDLQVSRICLGSMTWGEQNSEGEAFEQLDYAVEQGINFIDTAEMYPVPPKQETQTSTESYIGNWVKARGNRDQIILATKVFGRADWMPWTRGGGARLDRANILEAVDGSLKRLKTDYIDLYQVHWPDRSTNFFGKLEYQHIEEDAIPIQQTLETLTDLVKQGKVRHIGVSNETPWGVMKYLELAKTNNLEKIISVQNPYSFLNRSYEIGLAEVGHREHIGLLAYSPLGFGVLSGKYLDGKKPEGARLTKFTRFNRYTCPRAEAATGQYVAIARKYGLDPAQMALAYVNSRPFLDANIIGATTMDQLQANIASIDVELSEEVLEDIEAVHQNNPNPSP